MARSLCQWLERLEHRHPVAIDLGLARCGDVWQRLGAPRPGQRVVTVAGTNGKGSTVASICALAAALGHSTAAYTSPHLLQFNERLRLDGQPVEDAALVRAFETVEAARGDISLTYFEFTTLACLKLAADAGPDLAVLEVGLGGRLDTVNLVDADIAVITPIGLDHQAFLGPDRETIGGEKAGILRPGIPLVCSEAAPPASVMARAEALGCPTWRSGRDYRFEPVGEGARFVMGQRVLSLPQPRLAGEHQYANLGAALAATALLEPEIESRVDALAVGIRSVQLPGRLYTPPGHEQLLLDVGHNPMAAHSIAGYLADQAPVECVIGMLADKDAESVATILAPVVRRWYCAGLAGERGREGEALASAVRRAVPTADILPFPAVSDALAAAREASGHRKILVFGSFHTIADALRALDRLPP